MRVAITNLYCAPIDKSALRAIMRSKSRYDNIRFTIPGAKHAAKSVMWNVAGRVGMLVCGVRTGLLSAGALAGAVIGSAAGILALPFDRGELLFSAVTLGKDGLKGVALTVVKLTIGLFFTKFVVHVLASYQQWRCRDLGRSDLVNGLTAYSDFQALLKEEESGNRESEEDRLARSRDLNALNPESSAYYYKKDDESTDITSELDEECVSDDGSEVDEEGHRWTPGQFL